MEKIAKVDEILTVSDVADYLLCHPSTIYRLLKNRDIPAFRLGEDWRFRRSDIDQWIDARQLAARVVTKSRRGRRS